MSKQVRCTGKGARKREEKTPSQTLIIIRVLIGRVFAAIRVALTADLGSVRGQRTR